MSTEPCDLRLPRMSKDEGTNWLRATKREDARLQRVLSDGRGSVRGAHRSATAAGGSSPDDTAHVDRRHGTSHIVRLRPVVVYSDDDVGTVQSKELQAFPLNHTSLVTLRSVPNSPVAAAPTTEPLRPWSSEYDY